jgi:hypothetical protein
MSNCLIISGVWGAFWKNSRPKNFVESIFYSNFAIEQGGIK